MEADEAMASLGAIRTSLNAASKLLAHFWRQAEAMNASIDSQLSTDLSVNDLELVRQKSSELSEYDASDSVLLAWSWTYIVRSRRRKKHICSVQFCVRSSRLEQETNFLIATPYVAVSIFLAGQEVNRLDEFEAGAELWDDYKELKGQAKAFPRSDREFDYPGDDDYSWERVGYFTSVDRISASSVYEAIVKPLSCFIGKKSSGE